MEVKQAEVIEPSEPTEPSAVRAIVRGEIDAQIATAKRYPRSPKAALDRALGMATISVDVAEECFYKLPRDNKSIEGGSIRLAEILASCWGNLRAQSRTIAEEDKAVVVQGV